MCYISVRPERHSYPILKKNMEFVINLTTRSLAYATDWCGVNSGKDHTKFEEMKLTPGKASVVNAPIIEECPLCIECRVKEVMALGSHDMFIADVVNVQADDKYLDPETGAFDMQRADLLAYSHGKYYGLGDFVGKFGWSVRKKKIVMKKIYLILLILPFCFSANAQKFIKIEDKTFNWGGKVGVNAALPIVKSLTIDNQEMEDIRLQYKVGYQAAVFARANIDRFYIQPSLAWQYTEGDIRFNIPQTENSLPDGTNTQMPIGKNRITYKSATLEVPVMIGYYLVKEGPYALSMMFGPNIKYNYKTRYSTDMTDRPREFEDDNTPFGISIAAGLGVSIWRLFLDFSYEFGLNEVASDFREIGTEANQKGTLNIEKRTNIMSFSLGFLF